MKNKPTSNGLDIHTLGYVADLITQHMGELSRELCGSASPGLAGEYPEVQALAELQSVINELIKAEDRALDAYSEEELARQKEENEMSIFSPEAKKQFYYRKAMTSFDTLVEMLKPRELKE